MNSNEMKPVEMNSTHSLAAATAPNVRPNQRPNQMLGASAPASQEPPSVPEALAKLKASRQRLSQQLAPEPDESSPHEKEERPSVAASAASFLSKIDPSKDWYGQALKAAGAVTWEQAQAHMRQRVREHPLLAVGLGTALGFAVVGLRPWQITAFRAALGGMTFGARRWLWRQWGQPIMQAVVAETARSLMRPSSSPRSSPRRTRASEPQASERRAG